MKKNLYNKESGIIFFRFIMAASAFSITGCELFESVVVIENPSDDDGGDQPDPTNNTPTPQQAFVTPLVVRVFDPANNGEPISGALVSIDEGANDFIEDGEQTAATNNGIATFVFKETVDISDLRNEEIKITLKADQFLPTSQQYTYPQSANEELSIEVSMISNSSPPEGVEIKTELVETSEGTLNQPLAVNTSENSETEPSTNITLDTDVILRDSQNQPISGGLDVIVTNFTTSVDNLDTLIAFPSGFNSGLSNPVELNDFVDGNTPITENTPIEKVTTGYASIQMFDEDGNAVKTFDGGSLNVDINIPSSTKNPNTGNNIQVGDRVLVWSLDTDSGEWQFEKESTESLTISNVDNNTLKLSFPVSHLSYWSTGFINRTPCGSDVTINILDQTGTTYPDSLSGTVAYANGGWANTFSYDGSGRVSFESPFGEQPLIFKFIDPLTNSPICSIDNSTCDSNTVLEVQDFCALDGNSLQLKSNEVETTTKTLEVSAQVTCSNDQNSTPTRLERFSYYLAQENPKYEAVDLNKTTTGDTLSRELPHLLTRGNNVTEILYHIGVVNPYTRQQEDQRRVDLDNSPIIFNFETVCDITTGATGNGGGSGG